MDTRSSLLQWNSRAHVTVCIQRWCYSVTQPSRQLLVEIQYSEDFDRTYMDVRQHYGRNALRHCGLQKLWWLGVAMITVHKAGYAVPHSLATWKLGMHIELPKKWRFVAAWSPADWRALYCCQWPQQPHEAARKSSTLLHGFKLLLSLGKCQLNEEHIRDVASRTLPALLGLELENINQRAADHVSRDNEAKQKCDHSLLHVVHAFAFWPKWRSFILTDASTSSSTKTYMNTICCLVKVGTSPFVAQPHLNTHWWRHFVHKSCNMLCQNMLTSA